MRMALPVELVGPCGGGDDERVTASLAALMSAFTSFGEVRAVGVCVWAVRFLHVDHPTT